MILYLNLLPKTERREIRMAGFFRHLQVEVFFVLGLLVLLSGAVFYIKKNLENDLKNIELVLEYNKSVNKVLIADAKEINKSLEYIQSIQSNQKLYSQFLIKLSEVVPEGIRLTSVTLTQEHYATLSGAYTNREILMAFRDRLLDGFITDLDFPISNLLQQENGTFVVKGYVPEYIFKPLSS